MPIPEPQKPKKSARKQIITIGAIAVVVLLIFFGIFGYLIGQARVPVHPPKALGAPHVNVSLVAQNLLFYNNENLTIPYELLNYSTTNATKLYVNLAFFQRPPPTKVYILNWTNQCTHCGSVQDFIASLHENLVNYTIFNNSNE